jgi:hypothetical protein
MEVRGEMVCSVLDDMDCFSCDQRGSVAKD